MREKERLKIRIKVYVLHLCFNEQQSADWLNGRASLFGREGCGFEPHIGHTLFHHPVYDIHLFINLTIDARSSAAMTKELVHRPIGSMVEHLSSEEKVVGSSPISVNPFA